MTATFGDELLGGLKDRLRDARHAVRSIAGDRQATTPPVAAARDIARLSDRALSRVERLFLRLAPPPLQPHAGPMQFCPAHYAGMPAAASALRLRSDCYRVIKAIARHKGIADPLIHERRLAGLRGPDSLALQDPAPYAAGLAVALLRADPLVGGAGATQAAEIHVLAGLAFAACLINDEPIGFEALGRQMALAGEALRPELTAALDDADRGAALLALFGKRAPHLP